MGKVGIPPEQRDAVFAAVAAVLHLGNVSFVDGKEADSSKVAPGQAQEHLQAAGAWACDVSGGKQHHQAAAERQQRLPDPQAAVLVASHPVPAPAPLSCLSATAAPAPAAAAAATLLGVNKDDLEHALTTRSRVMREGVIVSPLNVRAAIDNRCGCGVVCVPAARRCSQQMLWAGPCLTAARLVPPWRLS